MFDAAEHISGNIRIFSIDKNERVLSPPFQSTKRYRFLKKENLRSYEFKAFYYYFNIGVTINIKANSEEEALSLMPLILVDPGFMRAVLDSPIPASVNNEAISEILLSFYSDEGEYIKTRKLKGQFISTREINDKRRIIDRYLSEFGSLDTTELSKRSTQRNIADKIINTWGKNGERLSSKRAGNILSVISVAFEHLKDDGIIAANPFNGVRKLLPETKDNSYPVINSEAIKELFTTDGLIKCKIDFLFLMTLLLTGCRVGEALALTKNSIRDDANGKYILIESSLSRDSTIKTTKTDTSRMVPLTPLLASLLEIYLKDCNSEFIFKSSVSELPYRDSYFAHNFKLYLKEIGEDDKGYVLYSFRHTFASVLADGGISDILLSLLIGHDSKRISISGVSRMNKVYVDQLTSSWSKITTILSSIFKPNEESIILEIFSSLPSYR